MSARALPEGWQFGPSHYHDYDVLIIGDRVVAKITEEGFKKAVFTDEYPEDVKDYIISRLEENCKYKAEEVRLYHQKVVNGVIDCVRSEMKVEES